MRRRVAVSARFRRRSHSWFAGAAARLLLARLLGQLAWLARAEQDAIACTFCRPAPGMNGWQPACSPNHAPRAIDDEVPKHPDELTPEEQAQVRHLGELADAAAARMDRLAPHRGGSGYADFIFGYGELP